jgi:two-component system CheB/CheR fusion protein
MTIRTWSRCWKKLMRDGHHVCCAADGQQALALARGNPPDIAILDLGMPGMNGLELARRIRSEPWGRGLMLIAATGRGGDEDRSQSRAAGFDHHLIKPIPIDRLDALLRRVAA